MPPKPRKLVPRKLGWVKDSADERDHRYADSFKLSKKLPNAADLRSKLPPVYDQGNINSCTTNAIAGAIEFDEIRQGMKKRFVPSRLFIYYNERAMAGTSAKDSGGQIRDGIKSVAKQGAPPEEMWSYEVKMVKVKPGRAAYTKARRYKTVQFFRMMHDLDELRSCLASGFPFIFGIQVYASFVGQQVANTGVVQMPGKGEKKAGLHAALACGYDDSSKRFIVRNSFGTDWGIDGYFTIPYAYLLDPKIAHDFWTLRLIK